MSLIADALKKVQLAKLGRRYLSSEPAGMPPGLRERQRFGGQGSFGSLVERIELSPTLMAGLVSGLLLFVVLFVYFFYGRAPKDKSPPARSVASLENRPAGLILDPPPSVQSVEPFILPRGEVVAREKGAEPKEVSQRAEPERSGPSKVEKRRAELTGETKGKGKSSEVSVASDLSEEVRDHFNLALFYQQERNFPLARREYERVVQIWPLYAEAHNNLGVVYKELGLHEQAIAELKKALALDPRYTRAYHNLGVIYQLKEDWKQAVKNYERALSLDRNQLSSYNNLGLVYRSQRQPHEAREVLEKALAINPALPQTHYNLALVLEEIGEIERARFHYQKFAESTGEDNSRLAEKVRAHLQEMAAK